MTAVYNKRAKKKATNISINSDLLAKARAYDINISSTVEKSLEEIVRQKEIEKWQQNNEEAINDYNESIAKKGLFSDGIRSF